MYEGKETGSSNLSTIAGPEKKLKIKKSFEEETGIEGEIILRASRTIRDNISCGARHRKLVGACSGR